jgi:hypothetical protein
MLSFRRVQGDMAASVMWGTIAVTKLKCCSQRELKVLSIRMSKQLGSGAERRLIHHHEIPALEKAEAHKNQEGQDDRERPHHQEKRNDLSGRHATEGVLCGITKQSSRVGCEAHVMA